ncbi:MAG: PPC domain-containing protein, partial [Thermodesulfobacteriota bacterium]|nr:PPC domain-containing protein [Thermodesulfobacteriota bacterium]
DELDLDGGSASDVAVTQSNAWTYYTTHVPFSNYDELTIETTGGTSPSGDVDLYVGLGSFPTTSEYDFISADDNDYTEVVSTDPNGGTYYIGLYGSPTFSDIDLTVNMSEGTWVDDEIPSAGTLDIDSTASGDFILSDNVVYKRDGRNWNVDQPLTGSNGNISEDVIYIQNGADIDIYEYNGSSWVDSGDSITGKTLRHAKGGIVVTGVFMPGTTLEIYDCTTLPCSLNGTITQPAEGVDTPPGDPDPDFNAWPEAVATDGNKVVVTDSIYEQEDNASGYGGIAYVFNLDGTIDSYLNKDDGEPNNQYGSAVDIYNDQVIVAERYGFAPGWIGGTGSGTAHIWENNGGTWEYQDEIYASDACIGQSSGCLFGYDVGIHENYAVVGHPEISGETYGGEIVYGSGVYIFEKTSGTPDTWTEFTKYKFDSDWDFGDEVAITGNYYYVVGGPTPSGGGIILSNNPSGSNGGNGGAVPEFSDYMLIIVVAITIFFMFKTIPKMGGKPVGRA